MLAVQEDWSKGSFPSLLRFQNQSRGGSPVTASGSGPLLADIEMVELVYHKSVGGELGHAGRLNGLEGRRPALRGVAVLLLRGEVGHAQPVMVLRLYLQATDHVLLRLGRHGPRPPVLPNPLSARNAVTAEEGGQEHGTC